MERIEAGLIKWAEGDRSRSAGVKLLIGSGRTISESAPWFVKHPTGEVSVEVDALRNYTRAYSSGEIAVIDIAASLLGGEPVNLADAADALDHGSTKLVLAAIAEAAGFTQATRSIEVVDGKARMVDLPAVYTWEEFSAIPH